ncbi:MAG TPA: Ku protein, partial [Rhizomicrobium sp.]
HGGDISCHLLYPEPNNRIRMIPTDPDTGPVARADLVKGYEIAKNKYVVVTNDELASVRLETTRTIDIERFVDAGEIDRLYWNDPYYLVPDGKTGTEAYTVIRDALVKAGRVAIGRVVMHTRERMVALEPRGRGIVATTLRSAGEVIDAKAVFADIPSARSDRQMVAIAEKIIAQKQGPFDPKLFADRYEAALRDLIRRKQKGEKPVEAAPVDDSNVIDLMAALKKSLAHKGKAANADARPKKRARG